MMNINDLILFTQLAGETVVLSLPDMLVSSWEPRESIDLTIEDFFERCKRADDSTTLDSQKCLRQRMLTISIVDFREL